MRSKSSNTGKRIVVDAIIVPPGRDGVGFGHDNKGRCVEFTGERAAMLAIVQRLREAEFTVPRKAVTIKRREWPTIKAIESTACPTHMLPRIVENEVA